MQNKNLGGNNMNDFIVQKVNKEMFLIQEGENEVGILVMNHNHELKRILFNTDDLSKRLALSQLALWHCLSYQYETSFFVDQDLEKYVNRTNRDMQKSDELVDFTKIPQEILERPQEEINMILRDSDKVQFIDLHFTDYEAVFKQIAVHMLMLFNVFIDVGVGESTSLAFNSIPVRFTVKSGHNFKIWNCVDKPFEGRLSDSNLHITPSYHPFYSGATRYGLINGDTDSYINSEVVNYLHCPEEAKSSSSPHSGWHVTWKYVKHPFYGEGKNLSMDIDCFQILSLKGFEEVVNIVMAALQLNSLYLEVSGGFCSPYAYSPNIKNPYLEKSARGSEQDVVWEYRTLEKEGQLEKSFVPKWFFKEKWLEMYPEVKEA